MNYGLRTPSTLPWMAYKYIFSNSRDQRSIIDYVITNTKIYSSQILDVRILSSANRWIEHSLVLCNIATKKNRPIELKSKINVKWIHKTYSRIDSQKNGNGIEERDEIDKV
jgi:hypothetical protein